MARIAGVDIPPSKRVIVSLTYIHGIGDTTAKKILKLANIDGNKRTKDLPEDEVARLRQAPDPLASAKDLLIGGDRRRAVATHVERLTDARPARGQPPRLGPPAPPARTPTTAQRRPRPARDAGAH